MNNASLQGGGRGLGAVGNAEFAEQAVDMSLHSGFGDEEGGGDFLVAVAADNEAQDVSFALGERGGIHALGEAIAPARSAR